MRQSERIEIYQEKQRWLWENDYAFACSCTRRDVLCAITAPQEGALAPTGPDGILYPGTCRDVRAFSQSVPIPRNTNLRLLMRHAVALKGDPRVGGDIFSFVETGHGPNGETGIIEFTKQHAIDTIGDIVLARRDMGTSYHLSVVLDDAAQGVTHVIRGQDLFEATKIHVILQRLLGLPTPTYHHHKLIRDTTGKRLAKRDDARAISKYRQDGATPDDVRQMVGL